MLLKGNPVFHNTAPLSFVNVNFNVTDGTTHASFWLRFSSVFSAQIHSDSCNLSLDISPNINNFRLKQNGSFLLFRTAEALLWGAQGLQKALRRGGQHIFFFAPWTLCDLSDPGRV